MLIAESDYYKRIIRFQRLPRRSDTTQTQSEMEGRSMNDSSTGPREWEEPQHSHLPKPEQRSSWLVVGKVKDRLWFTGSKTLVVEVYSLRRMSRSTPADLRGSKIP